MRKTIHGRKAQTWDNIHEDFKNTIDGVRYVLVMDEKGATVSMPYKDAKKRKLV